MGLLTVLKFLPLLAIALVGLFHINPEIFPGNSLGFPQSAQWSAAVLLVIYAFVGWEAAVIPAGETREPGTAMPLGLFWALGVVVLLYVVIQIVCVAVVPDLASSERALVDAGAILFGPAGALLLTLGVIVSVGGNITGTVVTTPRLTYALALEKKPCPPGSARWMSAPMSRPIPLSSLRCWPPFWRWWVISSRWPQ